MRLFVDGGYTLIETSPTYREDVMSVGRQAESKMIEFLAKHNISSGAASACLQHIRTMYSQGHLNSYIRNLTACMAAGRIIEPCPSRIYNQLRPTD